ncbi:MAG: hypothetical protein AAGA62_08670, partial [Bacteroidota bacterium]
LRWPTTNAPVLGFVEPGRRIGIIRSWIGRKPGNDLWYWEFDDPQRGDFNTFYVAHIPETLNMPRLQEDMQERDEAKRRRQLEWYQRVLEDGGQLVKEGGSQVLTGAMILGGLYVLGRIITKR